MPDDLVHVRLVSDDFPCDDLQVYEIAGRENLGRPFEIAIGVVMTAPGGLDLGAVEGAHAGGNYGHHFPLKPGTEVLIGFIDGDPDRPLILHSVPNPITPSPIAQNSAAGHRIKTATGILIEMKDA